MSPKPGDTERVSVTRAALYRSAMIWGKRADYADRGIHCKQQFSLEGVTGCQRPSAAHSADQGLTPAFGGQPRGESSEERRETAGSVWSAAGTLWTRFPGDGAGLDQRLPSRAGVIGVGALAAGAWAVGTH